MKDSPFPVEYQFDHQNYYNDATAVSIYLLRQVGPGDPINFCSLGSVTMVSMLLTIKISVSLFRVSHHLIGPFEEGLVLNIFQDLMHGLSEYSSNHLIVTWYLLLSIIPFRQVIIVSIQRKFSPLLRDKLSFPFSLLLIIFYPFILVHPIH